MLYQIKLQPSGHLFEANNGETILEAALRNKISFPFGCRSGICGTCLGKVLMGKHHYPKGLPASLSEQDHNEGKALFCTAIADSNMVLEVPEIAHLTMIKS